MCLLCASHNAYTAREAFGQSFLERRRVRRKRAEAKAKARTETKTEVETATRPARAANVCERALSALLRLGFGRSETVRVLDTLGAAGSEQDLAGLVRAALVQLTPQLSRA